MLKITKSVITLLSLVSIFSFGSSISAQSYTIKESISHVEYDKDSNYYYLVTNEEDKSGCWVLDFFPSKNSHLINVLSDSVKNAKVTIQYDDNNSLNPEDWDILEWDFTQE